MKNRYGRVLRDENRNILDLCPAVPTLRTVMALEFKKLYRLGMLVLEIGCGEGDSAEPVLKYTDATMDLLDGSAEMIQSARERLAPYASRLHYITQDAFAYLRQNWQQYDVILSSWTIHNFTWEKKKNLFTIIGDCLRPGGSFILMDKVYPNGTRAEKSKLLALQLARYRYLSLEGRRAITEHEYADFEDEYRMDEADLLLQLDIFGFRTEIVDRVERDVVIVAKTVTQ